MSDFSEIKNLIETQGDEFAAYKAKQAATISQLEGALLKQNRPNLGGSPIAPKHETWIDTKSKVPIAVLGAQDSALSLEGKTDIPSVGRVLRGMCLGSAADDSRALADERKALSINNDPGGGYTVDGALSAQWIDLLRSAMVLNEAGVRTVPMGTKTLSLARLTADPTCYWKAENAALTAGDPTFGAINLDAKTVVCLVKMSLELAQDSVNIEQILQSTVVQAMANAIDSAGLVGVTTGAAGAPAGIFNLSGRNSVTSIGAPTSWDFVVDGMYELMADNVDLGSIGAMIGHPAIWKKMRKLKTGIASDNTPLTMPDEVRALPKLWTTAAPLAGGTTAKAVIADWRDLLFGVRKQIQVQVLRETLMGSNLQIGILCYARVDFAATRADSFCTLEGITV